jgi:hypothetical protein
MSGLGKEVLEAGEKCITWREICKFLSAINTIPVIESRKVKRTERVAFLR